VAQGEEGSFTDIIGWFTDDAVKLIRGAKGTVVRLKILKGSVAIGTPAVEVRLVREKIKIEEQTAKKEILTTKNGDQVTKIGLITIPMFYRDFEGARSKEQDFKSTSADVKKFLNEFKKEGGVDAVVIDLRNNGGGSLLEAIDLTGLFITKGPVVQRKSSEGRISTEVDNNPEVVYEGPLAVMINRFSASASEIFAAAIQDYKRGIIVGEQSYGKGTVQSVVDLTRYLGETEAAGSLKITLEKFYRINGSSTQHKGVSPDFALPSAFTAEEYGESAQKSALPWDMIATSAFQPINAVNSTLQNKLNSNFQVRLKTNSELLKLKVDTEKFKKYKEKNSVSLLFEKRKKELDELKKQPDETESIVQAMGGTVPADPAKSDKDKKEDKHAKDVYLKETQQIVVDWLNLIGSKSPKIVMKK
jgi:carboxyl-terminal processing protease